MELEKNQTLLETHPIIAFWGNVFPPGQLIKLRNHYGLSPEEIREAANGHRPENMPDDIWQRFNPRRKCRI